MAGIIDKIAGIVGNHNRAIQKLQSAQAQMQAMVADLASRPRSVQADIDAIPGRRIESTLGGEIAFDANQLGLRGTPIIIPVSQDGPFVMTHYPVVMWRPTSPSTATNLGRWRPVSSFPLPTQQLTSDFIDIMWELQDGGNQRNFQNTPRAPLFSRPDALLPCAIPTLWSPNSTLVFTPTYTAITFNGGGTPTTGGTLHVDFYGYRIVNL